MKLFKKFNFLAIFLIFFIFTFSFTPVYADTSSVFPTLTLGLNSANTPSEFTQGIQVLVLLTILSLAPSIFILTTCFIRIVIVLALARMAIGTSTLPPSQVIVGLALILTFFVMAPTYNKINDDAIQPYVKNQITQQVALDRAIEPIRNYMIKFTNENEIALFIKMAKMEKPKNWTQVPTYILLPAYILSELKTAFKIGFVIFLPFLVIDIVVASVLVSMGMVFLPPTVVAMPFKLILFVMIDGWYLITKALLEGLMI